MERKLGVLDFSFRDLGLTDLTSAEMDTIMESLTGMQIFHDGGDPVESIIAAIKDAATAVIAARVR